MTYLNFVLRFTIFLSLFYLSCSDEELSNLDLDEPLEMVEILNLPFQEQYDQEIDRYLGTTMPMSSIMVSPETMEHIFDSTDGPVCFTGSQFSMFTRNGSTNDLLIFLQGGGFCGPSVCEAVDTGIPFIPFGILDPTDSSNPAADYNVGYIPYCDGSGMMGDNSVDSDGDGKNDRFFRGLHNLSASLDVVARSYPDPDRIVLAGNSAGGFAIHTAIPLIRKLYPEVSIDAINDSGQGIANPGSINTLFDYWKAGSIFPESCTNCIGQDGNLTDYHKYQLELDSNLRLAYISSKQDGTYAAVIAGGGPTFEIELTEAAIELNQLFPDRFHSLIADGDEHTFILKQFDYQVGQTTVKEWVGDMIGLKDNWTSHSD